MFKLIVFDWDDVITLGATGGYLACYHKAFEGVGIKVDPKKEREIILKNWGKTYREELKAVIGNSSKLDKALEIFYREFFGETFVKHLKLIKGVNELLSRLSKKYKLAVATGNHPQLLIEKIIPKFKIPNVFSKIMYSSELPDPKLAKPNPYMLQTIMRELGVSSGETLYVGDSKSDVLMANKAKVRVVVVLTGHLTREESEKLEVWKILPSVTYLARVLDQ